MRQTVFPVKGLTGITYTLPNFDLQEKTTEDLYRATAESIQMSNPDLKVLAFDDVVEAIGIISEGRLMDRDKARTLADLGLQAASPTFVRIDNTRL
jgi:hypothetical protein